MLTTGDLTMTPTKPRRGSRPLHVAGAPLSQRKLASATIPAHTATATSVVHFETGEHKPAYAALFAVAIRYTPAEAAEGLSMALTACLRTLGNQTLRTAVVDTKTGEKMVLEVKLVREGDTNKGTPSGRRKRH